jgi:hypothetical protein
MSTAMGKIGDRLKLLKGRPLPSYEFAFDGLPEAELAHCLAWECHRERAICRQKAILDEAKTVEKARLSKEKKFRQELELQNELDAERRASRPWILLSPTEKSSVLNTRRRTAPFSEPFRLVSEFSGLERFLFRQSRERYERLEVVVDWSRSNKRLVESFQDAVERLRQTPGTKANLTRIDEACGANLIVRTKAVGNG